MGEDIEHPKDNFFLPRGRFDGSIEFKNVTFTYPDQSEPVLDDISFKIDDFNRTIAITRRYY